MSSLRLSQEQVVWLQTNVIPQAVDDDLEKTYEFEHELNARRDLLRVFQEEQRGGVGPRWRWHLLFYDAQGNCLLQRRAPVARSVVGHFPLRAGGAGRVANNEHIDLEPCFQGQKFATALYAAEQTLYRRWAIREVHLRAVGAGVLVWLKPRFGFRPIAPKQVETRYNQWAAVCRLRRTPPPPPLPSNPSDYPKDFLETLGEVSLFKVLS